MLSPSQQKRLDSIVKKWHRYGEEHAWRPPPKRKVEMAPYVDSEDFVRRLNTHRRAPFGKTI